ncbi:MAG: aminoacyl-tRNA hydrolase [Oscillospiraceae bacterium]|jgi:PTH1 family peptidyl-tRNA hydrolase|nr:aminoacyl-tRNA hydrolase [Oscillospiraceae bacterium]
MLFGRKSEGVEWIAVFLGNPGARYEHSRHNAGFLTAGFVEKNSGVRINRLKFKSLTAIATVGGRRALLMKPQTYMNLSGDAVRQAMNFYKTPLTNVIAVSDDVSLPVGKVRVRQRGSSGGHNGLKDIIAKCGGEDFPRIKIGVGAPPHEDYDLADWVLSKPETRDEKLIAEAAEQAAETLEMIIARGFE